MMLMRGALEQSRPKRYHPVEAGSDHDMPGTKPALNNILRRAENRKESAVLKGCP